MDWKKVFTYAGSVFLAAAALLLAVDTTRAEDVTPHTLDVYVVDTDGAPVTATALGCVTSDYPVPTNYTSTLQCTTCSYTQCVFSGDMEPAEGAYVVSALYSHRVMSPTSSVYGQMQVGQEWQYFGMWYTNEASPGYDWEDTHVITFVLSIPTPTPTPTNTPTATPTPTPTPTSTPVLLPTTTPYYGSEPLYNVYPTPTPGIPNEGIWINSPEVQVSQQLIAPLPRQPQTSQALALLQPQAAAFPDLVFPEIYPSQDWPSISMGRDGVLSQVHGQIINLRTTMNSQYNWANTQIAQVKQTTQSLYDFVGNPQTSVVASASGRTVTVTQMAQEMSQSVSFSLSYLRAISQLGPLGLDLVFLFIGLAWIVFMNFLEWLVIVISWILKRILAVFEFLLMLLRVLLEIIRTIMALIPFF